MKEKTIFTVQTDVNSIEIDVVNAAITVQVATDGTFKIEYPEVQNISVGADSDSVVLSQRKYLFSNWKAQQLSVFIPTHTVPDVKIRAKNCSLKIIGGIYGELACSIGDGTVHLTDAVFGGVEITGDDVDAKICGVTIKGKLFLQIEKGNVLAENTFAIRSDCKVKKGNIGLAFVNCKDCAFNTDRGNITATIAGNEQSFNTTLITREGTLNREGVKRDGADGNFQAYADKGNIVLNFADETPQVPDTSAPHENGDGTTKEL